MSTWLNIQTGQHKISEELRKRKSDLVRFRSPHCYRGKVNCEKDESESEFFTQPVITCSKLTIETLEQGVKYVQS